MLLNFIHPCLHLTKSYYSPLYRKKKLQKPSDTEYKKNKIEKQFLSNRKKNIEKHTNSE